jgi:hypothetical protein
MMQGTVISAMEFSYGREGWLRVIRRPGVRDEVPELREPAPLAAAAVVAAASFEIASSAPDQAGQRLAVAGQLGALFPRLAVWLRCAQVPHLLGQRHDVRGQAYPDVLAAVAGRHVLGGFQRAIDRG